MLRCIGAAEYGAVLVEGGADHVMLPRLPNEPPPPARASARPGASARAKAVTAATPKDVRRMIFLCFVTMGGIWCWRPSGTSHRHSFDAYGRCISSAPEPQIVGRR